jgi:S-adenosyl methyltransferase
VTLRDRAQLARFFDGRELAGPGLVRVPEWRPAPELEARSPAGLWAAQAARTKASQTTIAISLAYPEAVPLGLWARWAGLRASWDGTTVTSRSKLISRY